MVEPLGESTQRCFIPPHAIFRLLWQLSPQAFRRRLGADRDKLRQFWTDFLQTPDGRRLHGIHPHLIGQTPESLSNKIPCDWHNDGGPVSKKHSAFVLNWGSILGLGSELETRFLSASWLKDTPGGFPEGVWEKIWVSIEGLAAGKVPEGYEGAGDFLVVDSDGTCFGAIFLTSLADGEYNQNELGMQGASHNNICSFCGCNRSSHPWTQLGTSAKWLETRKSNDTFLAGLRHPFHGMLLWPIFNIFTIRYDALHVVDHKGVFSKIWGRPPKGGPGCRHVFQNVAGRLAGPSCIWVPHFFGDVFYASCILLDVFSI